MNKKRLVFILLLVPILVLDAALFAKGKIPAEAALIGLAVLLVIMVGFLLFNRRGGERVEKDERTMKLYSKAAQYSWLLTIYVVALLMGCDTLGFLRLAGVQALGLVAMVMSFSFLILGFAFRRKGDLE
jgi:hypothetical protein